MHFNKKDKKTLSLNRLLNQLIYQTSIQIKFIIGILLFFLIFILINFSNSSIQINEKILPVVLDSSSSFILNAIIEPDESSEYKPVYNLVYPFGNNGIFIYNMSEPIESWWPFECYKTRMKYSINTKLCIYDPKYDKQISEQIKTNGLWEPTNVRSFMKLLNEVKDANVIDLGANIGLYSLLAAKLNRTVISIEPVHENLNRIHKAALLEQVQTNIIGLVNAVSNERKQLTITILDNNIGGSFVRDYEGINAGSSSQSVIVNSIIFDDVLEVIKTKVDLNVTRKFVLKIDIEAYEPFVFQNCTQIFKELSVVGIFMEFGKTLEKFKLLEKSNDENRTRSYGDKIKHMISLLKSLNFEPYEMNGMNKLSYDKWKSEWPWDVYFRQCDYVHCFDHVYKLSGF
ncbi:unnamed protein product [Brachionus calyciflorus]|uniref:Methyltransferase FkbM domain-containing protein n=1 Tax=Brachionus calyciflorus TaxID=104777 RepID=A0A814CUD4_9BILA|nr:unnamed protein product [Brachionus calyciflorus]